LPPSSKSWTATRRAWRATSTCATGARSGEAYDTAKLLRPDLNVYFLDAKVSYGGDGSFRIIL